MDEKEKNLQEEFSLDDILKEFGEGIIEEPAVEPETPSEPEAVTLWEPVPEAEAPAAVTGDTIRLDNLEAALKAEPADDPTRRFNLVQEENEDKEEFEDDEADEEEEDGENEEENETDEDEESSEENAFGEAWEPQYEQPIGDYVPPQPIVFRPRSRLRELKRKLIAGPEKRYYELSEQGVGKLQIAILLCLLVVVLSAVATITQAVGGVPENRIRLMVFLQFFAMLLSALLGSFQLLDGITDLLQKRFTLNTLMVFTFIACCADGVLGLMELRIPCCAAFSLEMLMSLWSTYHKRVVEMGQMDTLRKAVRLDGISRTAEFYEGKDGLLRSEGQVEDFMDNYSAPAKPEKILGFYGMIALGISIAAGIAAAVLHGVSLGVQVMAVSLLAAMPATAFITVSRPAAVLEKHLHRLGCVICGWRGVEGLNGKLAFPVDYSDLFPVGSCRMNGVKFYGDRDPDEVVAYAAALVDGAESGLAPLFNHLLDSRNGRHYGVENLNFYGNGGIGGEVNGEPVLAGDLNFMKAMGVEIPEGISVDQAVYVSIDGDLGGLFAITYSKAKTAAAGIGTLCAYRGITTVLTTNDFMLTESFIRSKFSVNTRRMAFPEMSARAELAAKEPKEGTPSYALTTEGGLASLAYAVTGARSLRTAAGLGVAIHMLGGIVGLAMMVILAVLGRGELLTPVNMLLYELVWMIPGLLITEWTRSV